MKKHSTSGKALASRSRIVATFLEEIDARVATYVEQKKEVDKEKRKTSRLEMSSSLSSHLTLHEGIGRWVESQICFPEKTITFES